MIERIPVELPDPAHPYGGKDFGEIKIMPLMAAIDSAIRRRLTELPMPPPKIRAALDQSHADD
jgi:CO/xanthine dehydrogenase Mo-binding subunit